MDSLTEHVPKKNPNKMKTKSDIGSKDNLADEKLRKTVISNLTEGDYNKKELILCSLFNRIGTECRESVKHCSRDKLFPVCLFEQIMAGLLTPGINSIRLIKRCQEFLEYDDIRYYAMKYLLKTLKDSSFKHDNLDRIFGFLEILSMPRNSDEDDCLKNFHAVTSSENTDKCNYKFASHKEQKQAFTWLWLEFLKQDLTPSLYKSVLVMMHEKIIPFMTNPLQLSDFLTQSYAVGGVVSLLALNGLFVLINKFNLNCTNFYENLYALLKPEIFFVKFRARFMFLLDLFLTSTHLPSYLVAAFAKKLSRLSLSAPPDALLCLIPLIYNLLIRHPNCKTLLHSSSTQTLTNDPFVESERDPAKSRALESCLWEVKSLVEHYHHRVSTEARKCEQPLPNTEVNVDGELETGIDDLIEMETRKKLKKVAATFDRPIGLISSSDKLLNKYWTLD